MLHEWRICLLWECQSGLVVALVTAMKLFYTEQINTFFGLMTIRGYTITMCNQPLTPAQPPSLLPSVGDEMSTRQGHWQYSAALKVLQVWHRAGNASQAMWTVENMMPQVAHCDGWQRNKNIPGGPVKSPTFVSVSIKFHCVLMVFFN